MIDGEEGKSVDLEKTVKEIYVKLKNGDSFGHYNVNSIELVEILGKVFLRINWETKGMFDYKMIELDNIENYHVVVDKQTQVDEYNLSHGFITQEELDKKHKNQDQLEFLKNLNNTKRLETGK